MRLKIRLKLKGERQKSSKETRSLFFSFPVLDSRVLSLGSWFLTFGSHYSPFTTHHSPFTK